MITSLQVHERSQVAEARRIINNEALAIDFDETRAGKLALVVTEIATNLVKHAGGGTIIVRGITPPAAPQGGRAVGVEVLAIDKGPGMRDLDACMRDGYSTGGSPGTGLGSIVRVSDEFDIYTQPGQGTVIMARFWRDGARPAPAPGLAVEAISLPLRGETACGDGWSSGLAVRRHQILVVDGLGHGPLAATAANEAINAFNASVGELPTAIIEKMHGALRSTRGAAASVAEIDLEERTVRYVGVGNVAGSVVTDQKAHRMISHNGTLGHEVRKVQLFTYPWTPSALLVMHSDGLGTQWDLGNYPGLRSRHLSVIAGVLHRDFTRGRDDSTILVARQEEEDR